MTTTTQDTRPTVTACHCGSFWCLDPEHLTPELRAEPSRLAHDMALDLIAATAARAASPSVVAHDMALDLVAGARRRGGRRIPA